MNGTAGSWFPGATARTDGDRRFLTRLRELSPTLTVQGLSMHDSSAASWASRPFVGIELRHLTAPLRWLWVIYHDSAEGGSLDCMWGDDTRYEDWGPIDGNTYSTDDTTERTSPEEAAEKAILWLSRQAQRPVRREDWVGRRPRRRWIFTDSGAVLSDTRQAHWRRYHAPDSTQVEQVAT